MLHGADSRRGYEVEGQMAEPIIAFTNQKFGYIPIVLRI